MELHSVVVDGARLAYRATSGTGRPIVFVHGNSASSRTWTAVLTSELGRTHHCLALDLPGHGESEPAADPATYSLPGYAATLVAFLDAVEAPDAVVVGWSLGGHIALEAAPWLLASPGFVIFGTPPVGNAGQLAEAFQPNPAVNIGYLEAVGPEEATAYASSFLAPGSTLSLEPFVADILRTDGRARSGLLESIGEGRFTDEVAVAGTLGRPLAIVHGEREQLVSLPYLQSLSVPTLWRDAVQVVPGAGHAPHEETPAAFAELLAAFVADLP